MTPCQLWNGRSRKAHGEGRTYERGQGNEKGLCGGCCGYGDCRGHGAGIGGARRRGGEKPSAYEVLASLNPQDESDWRSCSIDDFDQSMLFSDWRLGGITLHERMLKSAAGSLYIEGCPDERIIDEYVSMVKGGCEFVWVENYANLLPDFPMLQVTRTAENALLTELAAAVHEAGGHLGYQFFCMNTVFSGFDPATCTDQFESAHAEHLTLDELHLMQQQIIDAAVYLKECGFDGIEYNAAGNNIGQAFLSRNRNAREDEYGPQSFENRARLVTEIVSGVKQACGDDFVVQVLFNGIEANDYDMGDDAALTTVEENIEFAKLFEAAGADALHVRIGPFARHVAEFAGDLYFTGTGIEGTTSWGNQFDFSRHWEGLIDGSHSGCGMMLDVAAKIKSAVSIPVGAVTYMDPAHAPDFFEKALQDGKVDFFLMTRPLYADPEYVNKLHEGRIDEICPCSRCLHYHFDYDLASNWYEHCRVNARRMRTFTDEMPQGQELPALVGEPRKVAVVGGGPAGMEAARIAAQRGHEVTLLEKNGYLGGLLPFAAAVKGPHENIADFNAYLQHQLEISGVEVVTGSEADRAAVEALEPDVVVVATGGVRPEVGFEASAGTSVLRIDDVLGAEIGENVTIVGGNLQAVDVAQMLVAQGKHCAIVSPEPLVALDKGQSMWVQTFTKPMLYARGTRVWPNAEVTAVGDGEVTILGEAGCPITFACDTVIDARDALAGSALADELKAAGYEVHVVGDAYEDATKPHNIAEAIKTGNLVARSL